MHERMNLVVVSAGRLVPRRSAGRWYAHLPDTCTGIVTSLRSSALCSRREPAWTRTWHPTNISRCVRACATNVPCNHSMLLRFSFRGRLLLVNRLDFLVLLLLLLLLAPSAH